MPKEVTETAEEILAETPVPRDVETLVFERSRPDLRRLAENGFTETAGTWVKTILFHEGEFAAVIAVDPSGKVSGTVIEVEFYSKRLG